MLRDFADFRDQIPQIAVSSHPAQVALVLLNPPTNFPCSVRGAQKIARGTQTTRGSLPLVAERSSTAVRGHLLGRDSTRHLEGDNHLAGPLPQCRELQAKDPSRGD
jgi:hypothetical protein